MIAVYLGSTCSVWLKKNVRTNDQLTSRPAPEWRIQLTCVAATARARTVAGADKVNTRNTITTTATLKPSLTILESLCMRIVAIPPLSAFTSVQHNQNELDTPRFIGHNNSISRKPTT